jgi:hypothetical protein
MVRGPDGREQRIESNQIYYKKGKRKAEMPKEWGGSIILKSPMGG